MVTYYLPIFQLSWLFGSALPLAGVTASQLWANSLDAGELIDKLDADNQTALADLVRGFFSSDGQLIRIVDNHQ